MRQPNRKILQMDGRKMVAMFCTQANAAAANKISQSNMSKVLNKHGNKHAGYSWITEDKLIEYRAFVSGHKVCKKEDCKAEGKKQSLTLFRPIPGGGRSSLCKSCINKANKAAEMLNHTAAITILGGGIFLINYIKYKVGSHGFVFFERGPDDWVKSDNNKKWLDATVAAYV